MKQVIIIALILTVTTPAVCQKRTPKAQLKPHTWEVTTVVAAAYKAYLGRPAERGGFCGWVDAPWYSLEHLETLFLSCDEFYLRYGPWEQRDVPELVFRNLLGRRPTLRERIEIMTTPVSALEVAMRAPDFLSVARSLSRPGCGRVDR